MKYWILTLLLIPFVVNADSRIELDSDTCHFPYSENTDDEYKIGCPDPVIKETAEDGAILGYIHVYQHKVPSFLAPEETEIRSAEVGGNCVLRNDDGQEYQVGWWVSRVWSTCREGNTHCAVSYRLWCWQ